MQAVSDKERIHVLDVTRGIAVFGILLVNMRFFTASLQTIQWRISLWPEWWNAMTDRLIDVFVSGKFLSIFAFLFGYGMVIMKDRVEARGQPFARIYARRLAGVGVVWPRARIVHLVRRHFVSLRYRRFRVVVAAQSRAPHASDVGCHLARFAAGGRPAERSVGFGSDARFGNGGVGGGAHRLR